MAEICHMENSLLSLYLPEGVVEQFDISYMCSFCKRDTKEDGYIIHLVEKNILPMGYSSDLFETKDFTKPTLIQDFPARGKLIFLSIKRRRWREKNNKSNIIQRDLSFLTSGIKMTTDLSAFLKGTNRDPRRYDVEYL
jgi:hypothetical protein